MELKVSGVRETLRALKHVSPDLEKQTRKAVNDSVREVVKLARGYVPTDSPMSGWTAENWKPRGWDSSTVTRGIKRENPSRRISGKGWAYAIAVANTTASGMIYELAGSKSNGRTRQGRQFIRNIAEYPGSLPQPFRRLVVRAGIEQGPQARKSIENALSDAVRVTQRRLDSGRG